MNPFEELDLDPRAGIGAITARLKELAEDARTDAERERIRAVWEELTLHPARRLRAALFAHPESRAELGRPPPRRREAPVSPPELELLDLATFPRVLSTVDEAEPERAGDALDDDPILGTLPT